jgi:hypothetical protein
MNAALPQEVSEATVSTATTAFVNMHNFVLFLNTLVARGA